MLPEDYYKEFEKIEVEPYNEPPIKRYAMGEPICPQLIEFEQYHFFEPTEEEKKQRIICTAVFDITGGWLDKPKWITRVSNVKFYAKVDNPKTLKEFQNVHITTPDLDKLMDKEQQQTFIKLIYGLYKGTYLIYHRDRITFDPVAMLMRSDLY